MKSEGEFDQTAKPSDGRGAVIPTSHPGHKIERIKMTNKTESTEAMTYQSAISILRDVGVFTTDDRFRDGHTSASFTGSSIDISGSSLTQREVSDKDWMRFFCHLLAVAADRGLRPAELLAIGMATVLQGIDKAK